MKRGSKNLAGGTVEDDSSKAMFGLVLEHLTDGSFKCLSVFEVYKEGLEF